MTARDRRRHFESQVGFPLDPFQVQALDAVDAGRSVLVAAPTGSGKTVVGEYAVDVALDEGRRVFYTTPIKALSNQKYNDLVARLGADRVGLLTGDNSINGSAPVVVMTTEVLRNMIYARSSALDLLRWVVLDEVHYLQDEYRGPVWEEVIIHAPADVRLVCLSATVSNAPELAEWIETVRGPTDVVVETTRPVELVNHFLVGDRQSDRMHMIDMLPGGRPNPEGRRFDADLGRGPRGSKGRGRRRWYTPRRVEVIEMLAERNLLPAITFIFSRAACDDAVKAVLDSGMRLTTAEERERIREIVDEHLASMDDADLALLGYDRWLAGLEAGVAAHHAGMVPPFKEAVEAIFVEGLAKAIFATETLALGINMPARSVVIEKLTKFGGERHEMLTPGQYTQLTGRAGRRGIDRIGHAIVLWSPFVTFDEVAGLASSRSFELTSAFRPTYNMAANLVRRYDADQAVELLEQSFAQFRADRHVVRLGRRIEQRREALADAAATATCELGDVGEYRELQRQAQSVRSGPDGGERARALAALRPGEVIDVERGSAAGPAVVISVSERRGGAVKVRALGGPRHVLSLGPDDVSGFPQVLGRIELPTPFAPNNRAFLTEVRRRLRDADLAPAARRRNRRRGGERIGHPVEGCPDLEVHLRAQRQVERLERELRDLERVRRSRTASLSATFERILELLEDWDHLAGWELTEAGQVLARIYHESDLLVAESIRQGELDGLDPPTLAGVVATFTYEHRSAQPPPEPWFPPGPMAERIDRIDAIARSLNRDEMASGLPLTRRPDPGFSALAHAWASGDELDDVLSEETVSGGDFVRNVKQLIDLLRQIGSVAPLASTAAAARAASDALLRGVVVASSAVGTGADDDEPVEDLEEPDPGADPQG
ncbi:DEAD/DEAH box helicase [Actinomarinicola tropica]|uniref:DEAD/DEAH box helicase n=1 Tax=Actinomarinicola tropica TaxID=2789776 RepID=A0A5Q2RIB9_9ACTN|nr:DEAD/DEAH box helicase [Actinomarinicola tropica]QGG95284.1 DEAD/DEAH box helicase [Actinomarinicola tropica]